MAVVENILQSPYLCVGRGIAMGVWLTILALILLLGFGTAVVVCISAIKKKEDIIIASRIHHKLKIYEVIYANLGLVLFGVLLYYHWYVFVPADLAFVLFIVLSTRIGSGITNEGALVGTTFIDWEFMKSYKLVDDENDSNIVTLKIRANRKQYVLVCNRKDREKIKEIFNKNRVKVTATVDTVDS